MKRHTLIELYTKKLTGEASKADLEALEAYAKTQEEIAFLALMDEWWVAAPTVEPKTTNEEELHFNKIMNTATADEIIEQAGIPQSKKHRSYYRIGATALGVAAVFVLSFFIWTANHLSTNNSNYHHNEIVAKRGTKSKLILPDGSQVWLNSESKLSYNSSFNDSIREVTLEGEAYFDVVKDKKHPFVVKTSAISIHVLGTAFNVKSYQQDPTIETTLVRGMIEVHKNNEPDASKIILRPNEKLVYNKPAASIIKQVGQNLVPVNNTDQIISISALPSNIADSARKETSWVYGRLVFDGDSFSSLAEKMERWYNVKINIKNNKVANYRFAGVFEKENIEEALKALQLIAMFKYTIHENEIIIEK
jgi:ferric-dicitrate binding protein FerR (iron transport regulator)